MLLHLKSDGANQLLKLDSLIENKLSIQPKIRMLWIRIKKKTQQTKYQLTQ